MSLNEIGKEARKTNKSKGFRIFNKNSWPSDKSKLNKIHEICTSLCLIHSEVSEAAEAVRKLNKENFAEELADVIIRTTSAAVGLGIDLDKVVKDKLEYNKNRDFKHGGKAI